MTGSSSQSSNVRTSCALDTAADFSPRIINVLVNGRRSSVRLDATTIEALDALCRREGVRRKSVFEMAAAQQREGGSFSAALRTVVLAYWLKSSRNETAATDALAELARTVSQDLSLAGASRLQVQ